MRMAFSFSCFSAFSNYFHFASNIIITQYIILNITITYKDCSFSCNIILLITCTVRYVCTQTWARSLQAYTALYHIEQGMAGQHIQDRTLELLQCGVQQTQELKLDDTVHSASKNTYKERDELEFHILGACLSFITSLPKLVNAGKTFLACNICCTFLLPSVFSLRSHCLPSVASSSEETLVISSLVCCFIRERFPIEEVWVSSPATGEKNKLVIKKVGCFFFVVVCLFFRLVWCWLVGFYSPSPRSLYTY